MGAIGVYASKLSLQQDYVVSPEVQARLSRAESMLVRLEDRAERCEVRAALGRVLTRLEAVSSVRIEGELPHLDAILRAESLVDFDAAASPHKLAELDALDFADADEWRTTMGVVYFQIAAEHVYRTVAIGSEVGRTILCDLHSLARFGVVAAESGTRVRASDMGVLPSWDDEVSYAPPSFRDVPDLLDDLCRFINREVYSPIAQAALAHFQFECIKPFKTGMDKTGRLLSHLAIHRRGLACRLIAPIGLEPAIDTKTHARALLPYRFGARIDDGHLDETLNSWIDFCAHSAEVSVGAADACLDALLAVRDGWLGRIGRPSRGSATEALLNLIVGHPVLTVRQAAGMVGKSVSSVNEALLRLEAAGIVESRDGLRRNRVYVARDAVEMLAGLERGFMPNGPVARDSFGA